MVLGFISGGVCRGQGGKRKNTSISSPDFLDFASAELHEFINHST